MLRFIVRVMSAVRSHANVETHVARLVYLYALQTSILFPINYKQVTGMV